MKRALIIKYFIYCHLQTYDPKQCNPALYGEDNTMCKYTKDEANERCKDGGAEVISRKVTEQVRHVWPSFKDNTVDFKT